MKKIFLYISSLLILCLTSQAQQWISYTNFNNVSQMAFQPGGNIIWGATPGGIFSFSSTDTALIKHYTNVDGLPYIEASSVTLDARHNKWIGTLGGGLARLDSAGNDWTVFTRNDGLASDTVLCTVASGQNVFAGGYGSLSYYDGYNWFSLLAQQGYKLGNQTRALAARNDSLWIATDQGLRIVKISPLSAIRDTNNWTTFSNYDGLSSDVRCILLTDTLSVIGTANGAARLVGGAWQRIPGLGDQVRAIVQIGDSLFLATNNGVKLWHQNVLSDISPGLLSYNVFSLSVDEDQKLWAGCDQGLCRYDAGNWDNYVFPGIAKNYVQHVSVSKTKTVWTTDGNTLISNYKIITGALLPTPFRGSP
jgi:ligand-binding sensor domain-containing protein